MVPDGKKANICLAIGLIKALANEMSDEQLRDISTSIEVEMKIRRITCRTLNNNPENPALPDK